MEWSSAPLETTWWKSRQAFWDSSTDCTTFQCSLLPDFITISRVIRAQQARYYQSCKLRRISKAKPTLNWCFDVSCNSTNMKQTDKSITCEKWASRMAQYEKGRKLKRYFLYICQYPFIIISLFCCRICGFWFYAKASFLIFLIRLTNTL